MVQIKNNCKFLKKGGVCSCLSIKKKWYQSTKWCKEDVLFGKLCEHKENSLRLAPKPAPQAPKRI